MQFLDKVDALVNAIKGTPQFASLKKAKTTIDNNSYLRSKFTEFNKRQIDLLNGKLPPKEAELRVKELNEKYKELSKIPEIDIYLRASKQFNDIMTDIYKIINDSLHKEIVIK
jgi:cell fate (sporulation/competence/biofilm development) regulator YlbF (YheA/YmcA/DUF963 family)